MLLVDTMLTPAKAPGEELLVLIASVAVQVIQLLVVVDKSQPSASKLVSSCDVQCSAAGCWKYDNDLA